MNSLHDRFVKTDNAIKECDCLTPEEFWGVHTLVFEGTLMPDEGAEILSEMMLAHLQENISKKLIDKIMEEI